jgi:hypothetical protein
MTEFEISKSRLTPVDLDPTEIANAQDSLDEALEVAGDNAGAAAAYERALQLDPGFSHAADALKKLRPGASRLSPAQP